MKIICLQENLKKILNINSSIIGKNLTLPILNNILLEAENGKIILSSTNLEIGIKAVVSGKIEKNGKITIPAKTLTSFVNNLPNKKIEIETKNNQIKIKSENYKAQINGLPADEFPIIPKLTQKVFQEVENNKLKEALMSVVSMASVSDSRPEITGILFVADNLNTKFVATDSFRLAEKKMGGSGEKTGEEIKKIIPQRTISELIKILAEDPNGKTKITIENNQIFFETGNVQLVSRLIDGNYPDYQQIIPQQTKFLFKLEKEDLVSSLKLASVFSSKINEVKLNFNPKSQKLTINSEDPDLGTNESEIDIELEKMEDDLQIKNLEIGFNYRFLLDGLSNLSGKKIIFGLNNSSSPGIVKSANDNSYLYLLMPIKAS